MDLASQAKKTAACSIRWGGGRAQVELLEVGADDDRLVELAAGADATGIDCPFGWPETFAALLGGGSPPAAQWEPALCRTLRFRATDRRVREATGRWPLSVSSDLIAVPAMRCQLLLQRLSVRDRAGDGRVWEVYPAASLALWGFSSRGYKRRRGAAALATLAEALLGHASWLVLDDRQSRLACADDDAFDALVASLTARAAAVGLTETPPAGQRETASREGWIALPFHDSLRRLAG